MALNRLKTSSTGNRKSTQHREFIEELVNLLFCIEDEDFSDKITQKPYPKYEYQPVSTGPKFTENSAFLSTINQFSQHTQIRNSAQKRGYCIFCSKNNTLKKNWSKSNDFSTIQLNENLIEIEKSSEKRAYRGKFTIWQCQECQKYICKDCWSLHK